MKACHSKLKEYEKPEIVIVLFGEQNVICASTLVDTGFGNGEEDGDITFQ